MKNDAEFWQGMFSPLKKFIIPLFEGNFCQNWPLICQSMHWDPRITQSVSFIYFPVKIAVKNTYP